MPDAEASVKHEGGGCFDNVRLTLKLEAGKITEAKFRARACSGTIAACSALCEMLEGMSVEAAKRLTADDLERHLDGIPEAKRHSVELTVEAFGKALGPRASGLGEN